jgi:hypothetical protein
MSDRPTQKSMLLNFFVHRMLIAVRAKFLQFQPRRCVAAVFLGGVARNARRTLVRIGAALGAFQRNNQSNVLTLSHNPKNSAIETKF